MSIRSRLTIWIALLLIALLAVAGWWWRDKWATKNSGTPSRAVCEASDRGNRSSTAPNQLKPTKVPVLVADKVVSIPILWVGAALLDDVTLPVLDDSGVATEHDATLGRQTVTVPVLPDGFYSVGFVEGNIYSVEHRLQFSSGSVQLLAAFTCIDEKLPVSRGVRVSVVMTSTPPAPTGPVELHWSPLGWPRQQSNRSMVVVPQHRLFLTPDKAEGQLVPAIGFGFGIELASYTVSSPVPEEFRSPSQDSVLAITLQPLIPLRVDLDEVVFGAWAQQLKANGTRNSSQKPDSRVVIIEVSAVDLPGRDLSECQTHVAFERAADDRASSGGIVDSFELHVRPPRVDATLNILVRLMGGGVVAVAKTATSPTMTEFQVTAKLNPTCDLEVVVKNEHGKALPDMAVEVGVSYRTGKVDRSLAYKKGKTSAEGTVLFKGLPAGEQIFAYIVVKTSFPYEAPSIELKGSQPQTANVVVSVGQDRILRVRLTGTDKPWTAVLLEGDGNGSWHRLRKLEAINDRVVVDRVRSDFVHVLGQCGDCFFSECTRITNDETLIEFDVAKAVRRRGMVATVQNAVLYPFDLSASVLWGSTRSLGGAFLPHVAVTKSAEFGFRIIESPSNATWNLVTPLGEVMRAPAIRGPSDAVGLTELVPEQLPVSKLEVTADLAKIPNATQVALVICPVFFDSREVFEAELQVAVRVDLKDSAFNVPALVTGHYAVFLVYRDKAGVTRMSPSKGLYTQFEIRKELTTKVHLPIK